MFIDNAASPLDLGKLRDRLEVEAAREQTYPVCLTSRQCLHLVEIAEAARDYFGQSLPYSGDPDADLASWRAGSARGRPHALRLAPIRLPRGGLRVTVDFEATMGEVERSAATTGLPPLDSEGVLWIAAIECFPIEERIAWVAKMKARVDEINAARATYDGDPLDRVTSERDALKAVFDASE